MPQPVSHLKEHLLFKLLEQFAPLTMEQRQAIVAMNLVKQYRKGSLLLREGEFSDNSYLILKGCLRSYYLVEGEEKTTAFYTETESFSPACVTTQQPSAYYVACVEDTVLTIVNSQSLEALFQSFPQLEQGCRGRTEQSLANRQEALDQMKIQTPEQRYLHLLNTRPDLLQRVPQYQIASYLGIKPPSLSRLRARMSKKHSARQDSISVY